MPRIRGSEMLLSDLAVHGAGIHRLRGAHQLHRQTTYLQDELATDGIFEAIGTVNRYDE